MLALLLLAAAPALPDTIVLKTPTETFTATHDLALRDGRIWWRRRGGTWALLPPDGLPAARGRLEALKELAQDLPVAVPTFRKPTRVVALSADGDNLVAISDDARVYYAKLSSLDWTDTWGPVGLKGPLSVAGLDAIAMSHRKIPYEDVDGNPHPVSAGVTTFYALKDGGRTLAYADPWLPPRFEHTVCLPKRGTFVAAALSASASTVFVMDAAGHGWTRLVDFDTLGEDPALPYSYAREQRRGPASVVRTLPAEDWRPQPPLPGPFTLRLTILQTGTTNADRELRVQGDGGYWTKRVFDDAWTFVKASVPPPAAKPVADAPTQPARDEVLAAANPWKGTTLTLRDFNPDCPPARLVLAAGAETLELPLPFHGTLDVDPRARHLKGALLLPKGRTPWLKKLGLLAKGAASLEVTLEVTDGEVRLQRLPLPEVRFPRVP